MGFVKLRQIHIENEIIKMRDASCADFNAAISAVKTCGDGTENPVPSAVIAVSLPNK